MNDITLVGGTGFLGQALARRLLELGRGVVITSRRSDAKVPEGAVLARALAPSQVVVNLAGEPIVGRWTAAKWARIEASRLDLTRSLVDSFGEDWPRTFVSASAVGIYGDRGEEELTEASALGQDRTAGLCIAWEGRAAEAQGPRVVQARIGLVMGAEGGALGALLTPFRLGLGGPVGGGGQWQPWIHLEDLVEGLIHCIDVPMRGPVNLTSPNPVRQADFARTLAALLGRPAWVPAPAVALRLALGEAAELLLASQRVLPAKLLDSGFVFRHPELDPALRDLILK